MKNCNNYKAKDLFVVLMNEYKKNQNILNMLTSNIKLDNNDLDFWVGQNLSDEN